MWRCEGVSSDEVCQGRARTLKCSLFYDGVSWHLRPTHPTHVEGGTTGLADMATFALRELDGVGSRHLCRPVEPRRRTAGHHTPGRLLETLDRVQRGKHRTDVVATRYRSSPGSPCPTAGEVQGQLFCIRSRFRRSRRPPTRRSRAVPVIPSPSAAHKCRPVRVGWAERAGPTRRRIGHYLARGVCQRLSSLVALISLVSRRPQSCLSIRLSPRPPLAMVRVRPSLSQDAHS
jgi:hypothetical protein